MILRDKNKLSLMNMKLSFFHKINVFYSTFVLLVFVFCAYGKDKPENPEEELYGVKYAGDCEVCKYVVVELESRLSETGKSHDVIETGYQLDPATRKKKKYAISELRLVESLDGICDRLLEYNIHKERKDSTRFAKGMSQTFKVLHGLVDKGVKVELGIPEDLWDKPSAEVTHLKTQCENLVEKYEEAIENWYFNHQEIPLRQYLCIDRVLQKEDTGCLEETLKLPEKDDIESKGDKPKKKKSKKKPADKSKESPNQKGESKVEL